MRARTEGGPQRAPIDRAGIRPAYWLAAILLATAMVYARGLSGELVYDDRLLIERNPLIADIRNLPRLFTSGYWDFLDLREAQYIGYWRPLTSIVQALVWVFAKSQPTTYHLVSLGMHLGAIAGTWFLALRLGAGLWVAAGTALLFALHPAHVESVAWISALNDPLFGCLALFAVERFLAWRRRGSRGYPLMALLCFALALLAKELAAALIPLILLLDLLRERPPSDSEEVRRPDEDSGGLLERALSSFRAPDCPLRAFGPFAAVFALYLVARMLVFSSPWAGFDRITTDFMVDTTRMILLRIELFGGALEILTLPIELNLFRPFRPYIETFDPALVRAVVFTAVYLALLVACFLGRRRLGLVSLLALPAGLLPALVKVQSLGIFPLSERFLYLPAFGFALGVALLLTRSLPRPWATASLLALASLYSARTFTRIGVWHDEETLFRQSAIQSPRSVYVQWGFGRTLLERLNSTGDARYLIEAQEVFEEAARLLGEAKQPDTDLMVSSRDYLQVNLGLAWCSIYAEDWSAAMLALGDVATRIEAIREQEREAHAMGLPVREQFLDLEQVYTALGVAQYRSGDFASAEGSFKRALELQPSSPEAHQNLGRMYAAQKRWDEAAREFEASSKLRPGNPEDRLLLAQTLQTQGKSERAEALAHELLEEIPGRGEPFIVLATGALNRGESTQALAWLEAALAIEPRNATAWYQKARALLQREDGPGALAAFRNAVEIDPSSFEAHYDCASFLLSQGAIAEALPYLVRAYTHAPAEHLAALRGNLIQMEFDGAAPLLELAGTDSKRGDNESALTWLERALELEPGNDTVALRRARLLRRVGRHEEALAAFGACAQRAQGDFELWSEWGSYLHSQGRTDQARPVLEHALELELPAHMPAELRQSSKSALRKLLEEESKATGTDE